MARSHGTRAPTPRASRVSRVRVARSRVRPMVRMYIAHVGVDPPGVTAPAVVADWTVGCTVARSHGTRAPASRANRIGRVCVGRSRVRPMVRMYIAHWHVGVEVSLPTWSDFSRAGLHRGSIACHLGRNLRVRRLTHGPCVCSIQDKTKVDSDVITFPDVNSEHIPHASDTGHVLAGRPPVVPCGQSLVDSRLRRG